MRITFFLTVLFIAGVAGAQTETGKQSEVVQVSAKGDIISEYSRDVISNLASVVAHNTADAWSNYTLAEGSGVVERAISEVAEYRNQQESYGVLRYYITDLGESIAQVADTNVAVSCVSYFVEDGANDSIINHIIYAFSEGATATNRIEFTQELGGAWEDVPVLESYATNIVVKGKPTDGVYFKVETAGNSGFMRLVGTVKTISIGDGQHVKGRIIMNNKAGLTIGLIVTNANGQAVSIGINGGIITAGEYDIGTIQLMQDDTAYPDEFMQGDEGGEVPQAGIMGGGGALGGLEGRNTAETQNGGFKGVQESGEKEQSGQDDTRAKIKYFLAKKWRAENK